MRKNGKGIWILKALLAAYMITALSLLILALLLYKMDLGEEQVSMGIIVIYVISTFAGGFIMGKLTGVKKFLWGLLLGSAYFVLLVLVSFGVNHSLQSNGINVLTTFFLCAGGGMLGGMVS